ncbi:MauE/DoxX family redox-associated membrane protein [Corallococcus sicarius]|uniref:MauE/DoxX family redox-associated membrane protein n=1 Tax=Corallococcus sicarius TaxID=2316726 RepID=UPI001FC9A643|nr:MauE/DoxX family redox-associated membrane protein [Corallococcus sicarius]
MSAVDWGCRLLLAVVFALAAGSKARSRESFKDFTRTLGSFGVPKALAGAPLAAAVVLAEALCVLLLLAAAPAGYALALMLLGGFTLGLVRAWRGAAPVSCRCFGASATPVGPGHLVRNGLLLSVGVLGALGHQAGPAPLEAALLAGAVGGLAGVFVTRWDDLVFLLRGPQPTALKKSRR